MGVSCVSPFQWRSCRCCVHLVASMHLVAATLVHLAFSTRVLLLILFWQTHTDVQRIIIAFPQSHRFVSPPLDLLVLVQVARDRG